MNIVYPTKSDNISKVPSATELNARAPILQNTLYVITSAAAPVRQHRT